MQKDPLTIACGHETAHHRSNELTKRLNEFSCAHTIELNDTKQQNKRKWEKSEPITKSISKKVPLQYGSYKINCDSRQRSPQIRWVKLASLKTNATVFMRIVFMRIFLLERKTVNGHTERKRWNPEETTRDAVNECVRSDYYK